MLEAMQKMLLQTDMKLAENQIAQYRLQGYRMALNDLIETYKKLEKQNAETPA